MSDLEIPDVSRSPRLHAYTSVWRLRSDAWGSLADVTKRLSDDPTPGERRPALQEEARELVRLLDPLETYWAYPGRSRLEQIALLCDIEDYESAMRKADTVTRVISGNTEEAITAEAGDASAIAARSVIATGRPAFQVLV